MVIERRGRRVVDPTAGAAMRRSVPKLSTLVHPNLHAGGRSTRRRDRLETCALTLTPHRSARMVPARNQSHLWSKLSGEEELPMGTGRETRDEAGQTTP